MALRIKSHWYKDKDRSMDEIASAVGYIIYKIATNGLLEMENEGFITYSNQHRLDFLSEYLAFLLQVSDRLAYERMEREDRQEFINAIATYLCMTFVENKVELFGKGDYRPAFVTLLNQRAGQYAPMTFADDEAKIDFLRVFGKQVEAMMDEKDQRWISQYIMEVEAPPAVKRLVKSIDDLF